MKNWSSTCPGMSCNPNLYRKDLFGEMNYRVVFGQMINLYIYWVFFILWKIT